MNSFGEVALIAVPATVGTVLLVAALSKFDYWDSWSGSIFGLFRPARRAIVRRGLPGLELAAAFACALAPHLGLIVASGLFLGLSVGVASLLSTHRGSSCACFGPAAPTTISVSAVARNATASLLAGGTAVVTWGIEMPPPGTRIAVWVVTLGLAALLLLVADYQRLLAAVRATPALPTLPFR